MQYFVVADIHGFFDELMTALKGRQFDENNPNHKLIICGDLLDRGKQANEIQKYVLDLLKKDKVILIRGNHEDLLLDCIREFEEPRYISYHHHSNGTVDTICQLTGLDFYDATYLGYRTARLAIKSPFVMNVMPKMKDYFETKNHIFVHGWIPATNKYNPDWRNASKEEWDDARWQNGIEYAVKHKVIEPNKTIVCGHWHCSYGHEHYGDGDKNNFSPYYNTGIIAIDGCTALTKKVNCIVIDDEPIDS